MSLYSDLQNDLKDAMRSKDESKLLTLRSIIAAVKNYQATSEEARKSEITDELIIDLISKEAKKRKEAIESYEKLGREELAASEKEELEILNSYLPKGLDEKEIMNIVLEAIHSTGAKGPSDLGLVMRQVMPKVKGRADGGLVNKIVRDLLGSK